MIFNALLGNSTLWLVFLVSALLTLFFASKAVKYFTVFSTRSKMNSSSLGGILLALITSMPELVTGFVGGASNESALVYSNVTGANSILLVFFAIFAIYFSRKAMFQLKSRSVVAVIGTAAASMVLFSILFFAKESLTFSVGDWSMSGANIMQLLLYVALLVYSFKGKNDLQEEPSEDIKIKAKKQSHIIMIFFFFSACLIISAILLNNAVTRMGAPTSVGGYGIGTTLAGALFLSIVTTLPEIVSMYKLMKVGLLNVAAAAGIGSHVFNFTILFISDAINSNSLLEQVYQTDYRQQLYLWGIYIASFLVFINGMYNRYLKKHRQILIFNYICIPTIFITGWISYAVFG